MHLHGRRLYLTVNTLIKDREMEKQMYDYLLPLLPAGAGCGDRAGYRTVPFYPEAFSRSSDPRKYPDDAYGSGWGEVSGKGRCTADCYIQRTEYGRGEKKIADETELEIESFVHGALCYCYSGQCLFSSFIGGRSGNRGQCAQPCRLLYRTPEAKRPQYLLSLKDICTLELIPR